MQIRDVVTGEVVHGLDVTNWCVSREANFPCVLLDDARIARTTPLYDNEDGTVFISAMDTGRTLAEYGPFPMLADVLATPSPGVLILVGTDPTNMRETIHGPVVGTLLTRLDLDTGDTALIGSLPTSQPWLCALGTDSVLAVDGTTLQVLGPAVVAPVEVPERSPTTVPARWAARLTAGTCTSGPTGPTIPTPNSSSTRSTFRTAPTPWACSP